MIKPIGSISGVKDDMAKRLFNHLYDETKMLKEQLAAALQRIDELESRRGIPEPLKHMGKHSAVRLAERRWRHIPD